MHVDILNPVLPEYNALKCYIAHQTSICEWLFKFDVKKNLNTMLTREIQLFGKHPQKITTNKMTNVLNYIYHGFYNTYDYYTIS